MNGEEGHHYFDTGYTPLRELKKLFDDIEKIVKEIYAEIDPKIEARVFIPVAWDPEKKVQIQSEWDGVVVVHADRQEKILEGYEIYKKRYQKDEYPRRHITRTKTVFLYTVDELLASEEETAKWEEFRERRKAARTRT